MLLANWKIRSSRKFPGRSDRGLCQQCGVQQCGVLGLPAERAIRLFRWGIVSLFLVFLMACIPGVPVSADETDQGVPNVKKPRPKSADRAAIIEFNGDIDWKLSKYFRSRLEQAQSRGIDLLIIEIDSPGGLKTESLNIAEQLRDVDWAYTIAFIPRQAISGAALVSLGCDEIMIGPNASYGDIGPIEFDPELFAFRLVPAKVQSVLVNQARNLAAAKGRPPELAEAMIDKDVLVYRRQQLNRFRYKTVRFDADKQPEAPWQLIPETGPERFLTVSGGRAKELEIAETLAIDRQSVVDKFEDLDLSEVRVFKYTTTDSVVYYLNHPVITGLLVIVGLIALYIELSAPGIGAGGLLAGLCAALFFWSRFFGGTSTWLEIVLFLAGVTFLIFEIFVIPGWGISGLAGFLLIVASIIMASQDFVVPQTTRQWNQFLTSALMVLFSGCVVLVAAAFLTRRLGSLPVFNRMVLNAPVESSTDSAVAEKGAKSDAKPIQTVHPQVSVGDWGVSESLLRPAGRAVFAGRSFDVVSDGSFVEPGNQIKVIAIQGNRIVVSPIEDDGGDAIHRDTAGKES